MQTKSKKRATKASSEPRLRAIFASVTPVTAAPSLEEQKYQAYTCANCSSRFAMNQLATAGEGDGVDAVHPMCPDCGSDQTEATEGDNVEFLNDDDSAAVSCESCATQMIFSQSTMAGLHGAINCTVCASVIAFSDEGEEDNEVDVIADPIDDLPDAEEDLELTEDEEVELDDLLNGDDDVFANEQDVDVLDGETSPDEEVEADADDIEDEAPAVDENLEIADGDLEELDLIDAAEALEEEEQVARFIRAGDRIIAMVGDISVGTKSSMDVTASMQDTFNSPRYLEALRNSATVAGMSRTLNDFGFKRTSIKVAASAMANLAETRVHERAEALASVSQTAFERDFAACAGIAGVGINKGFWPGEAAANPIKIAIANELRTAGVRNPEAVVDRAFASKGKEYLAMLFSKANELQAHPTPVRNSIATAIEGMAYSSGFKATASDVEDEDTTPDDTVTTANVYRSGMRPAPSAVLASDGERNQHSASLQGGVHQIAEALRAKGGRVF